MILETDNGKYCVHIRHVRPMFPSNGRTELTIHPFPCAKNERPCGTPVQLVGVATCHENDQFNRALGRVSEEISSIEIRLSGLARSGTFGGKNRGGPFLDFFLTAHLWNMS